MNLEIFSSFSFGWLIFFKPVSVSWSMFFIILIKNILRYKNFQWFCACAMAASVSFFYDSAFLMPLTFCFLNSASKSTPFFASFLGSKHPFIRDLISPAFILLERDRLTLILFSLMEDCLFYSFFSFRSSILIDFEDSLLCAIRNWAFALSCSYWRISSWSILS